MTLCADWATADDAQRCGAYTGVTDAQLDPWLPVASEVLFNLTGRRWPGVCEETVRPCGRVDLGCPGRCSTRTAVPLGYPVVEVTEVVVDGAVVPTNEYEVQDRRLLVGLRDAGGVLRTWPCCQDLTLPTSEPGTFEVTYSYGADPPEGGVTAAAVLAGELAKACVNAGDCRLPKNTQTIARQGVTVSLTEPGAFARDGLTGIPEVDLWISSVLTGDRRRRAAVMIPGRGRRLHRTGSGGVGGS